MKLNSALPKGDADGLSGLEAQMIKKQKPVVAMVILEPAIIDEDLETHEKSLKVRIRRIEALLPDDVEAASRLLQRSFESRTGDSTLPIELENDIKEALKGVDTYVPETPIEKVIDVPEGGYSEMTVPLLRELLKKRGLNHSQATKTELINRLKANDENPDAGKTSNVTSIFMDGSTPPADVDEPVDEDETTWNDAAPHADEDEDYNPAEYPDELEPADDDPEDRA